MQPAKLVMPGSQQSWSLTFVLYLFILRIILKSNKMQTVNVDKEGRGGNGDKKDFCHSSAARFTNAQIGDLFKIVSTLQQTLMQKVKITYIRINDEP